MTHFNKLTPAEAERLAILSEECAEVIQVIGKILRHGYESGHPQSEFTNKEDLQKEIGDVAAVIDMMIKAGDLNEDSIEESFDAKPEKMSKYLHHQ